jgi:hypothetical protein
MSIEVDGKRVPLSAAGIERFKREHKGDAGKKLAKALSAAIAQAD